MFSNAIKSALLFAVIGYSSVACADNPMKSVFDGIMTNSSDARSFSTQTRWGATGGGVTVRIPSTRPRIISVVPPRASASCGGADFFLGSFSLINKDQLVQVMRGIANGAATYAFNLGMAAVCATCATFLNDLAAKLNNFNKQMQDSCSASYNMLSSGQAGLPGLQDATQKTLWAPTISMLGLADDAAEVTAQNKNAVSELATSKPDAVKAMQRNVTWDLIKKLEVQNWTVDGLASATGATTVSWQEILMSLIGTVVFTYDATAKDLKPNRYSVGTKLSDLVEGNDSVKFLTCEDGMSSDKCLNVVEKTVSGWQGLHNILLSKLLDIQPKLRNKVALTPDEKGFVAFLGTQWVDSLQRHDTGEIQSSLSAAAYAISTQIVGGTLENMAIEFQKFVGPLALPLEDQMWKDEFAKSLQVVIKQSQDLQSNGYQSVTRELNAGQLADRLRGQK